MEELTGDRATSETASASSRPSSTRSVVIGVVALVVGLAVGRFVTYDPGPGGPGSAVAVTPAERIVSLERATFERPDDPGTWQQLGIAYTRQSIATGDPALFDLADRALDRAETLDPDAVGTKIARGTLLLSLHEFADALALGHEVLDAEPRNPAALAVVVDAQVELGAYEDAATSLQRLLDVRPNLPALARTSYLRQLNGDLDGALTAIRQARAASGGSSADLADVLTIEGEVQLLRGRTDEAAEAFDQALRAVPDHGLAEFGRAKTLVARGDLDAAVDVLDELVDRRPTPASAILLGELQTVLDEDPTTSFALADAMFDLQIAAGQVVDLEAALLASDHGDSALGVRFAQVAYDSRRTVFTADALAWALHRDGRSDEAVSFVDEALALETADPVLLVHGAAVLAAAGRPDDATMLLRRATERAGYLPPPLQVIATGLADQLGVRAPGAWR